MIASPCKNCVYLYLPKDLCMQNCEKIKNLQNLQHIMPAPVYSSIDSSDMNRYRVATSTQLPLYD